MKLSFWGQITLFAVCLCAEVLLAKPTFALGLSKLAHLQLADPNLLMAKNDRYSFLFNEEIRYLTEENTNDLLSISEAQELDNSEGFAEYIFNHQKHHSGNATHNKNK